MYYLAIRDNFILGIYKSRAEAEAKVRSSIQNDKLIHILKRGVAKKLLSGKDRIPSFEDKYTIVEVTSFDDIYFFDPTKEYKL